MNTLANAKSAEGLLVIRLKELRDAGLAQLHIVFGGPGSGKSYFFMHVLRQLADRTRWNEPWGGLLLDPKGTIVYAGRTLA